MRAAAPRLQQSGALPLSEVYTATSADTLQSLLTSCTRTWALELLEANSSLSLATVAPMESCVATPKEISSCMVNSGGQSSAPSLLAEVVKGAACADLPAGTACTDAVVTAWVAERPDLAAALTASPVMDPMGSRLKAPADKAAAYQISSATASGPVAWRSGCACSMEYAPVCEMRTRKQYTNECSANCQVRWGLVGGEGCRGASLGRGERAWLLGVWGHTTVQSGQRFNM